MSFEFGQLLRAKLAGICEPSNPQIEKLKQHYELLCRWNRVLNLTSVRTMQEAVERHYCESLFAAAHLPESGTVADIGSGGGFPGIPIAIFRPQLTVTLVESHQRKAAFLKEAARELANVRVVAKRVEDVGEVFDWAVSRAVRLAEVAGVLEKLAGGVLLLTGEVAIAELPDFEWRPPIRLPWGDRRFLWIGAQGVSRGT